MELTKDELVYLAKFMEEYLNAGFGPEQVTIIEWGMPDHVDMDACQKILIDNKYVVTWSSRTQDWGGNVNWVEAAKTGTVPDTWECIIYIEAERAEIPNELCTENK